MNEEIQATPKTDEAPVTATPAPAAPPPQTEAQAQAAPQSPGKPAPKAKPKTAPTAAAGATPAAEKPASSGKAAAVQPPAPAEPPKATKVKRHAPAKPKLIRDSFTLPENDYALFASLKQRALEGGAEAKKSELLRAGLAMLARADDAEFLKAVGLVERIKTGRPKK